MNKKKCVFILLCVLLISLVKSLYYLGEFSRDRALKLNHRKDLSIFTFPDDSTDRIFWFIQLSDLHLSQFRDKGRTPDLFQLCLFQIPVIAPDIVIVSGDITDGKFPNMQGSMQFVKEWKAYENIVKTSGVLKITKWLDLRGNHDVFNVPSPEHEDNYFRQYSAHGPNFTQSYIVSHRKSFGTYSFIGLDACPSPGLKRPNSFFGMVTTDLANTLQSFSNRALGSNQTFWFGHYPTSTIVSPGFDLRGLIGKTAYSYFCGHLHTLLNFVPNMYTVQPQGFLELELADWRDGRFFRIVAVDNDLVSFVDTPFQKLDSRDWPLVLITNPKDAAFLLPNKEPVGRIIESTHIRVLAWSKYPIKRVSVTVDGVYLGDARPAVSHDASVTNSPLYVLPWKPWEIHKRHFPTKDNTHWIEITCEDAKHNIRTKHQSFTLDGTVRWNFGRMQNFILLGDQTSFLVIMFYLVWLVPFLVLVTARLLGNSRRCGALYSSFLQSRGLLELANCDSIFYSLFAYLLYVISGPTFMGYLLDYHFGFVFTFGILIENALIPESTTYLYETVQQIIFTYPLLILLSYRIRGNHAQSFPRRHWFNWWPLFARDGWDHLAMGVLICVQMAFTVTQVLFPYRWLAFFLSPGRLWYMFLGLALFRLAGRKAQRDPLPEPPAPPRTTSSSVVNTC